MGWCPREGALWSLSTVVAMKLPWGKAAPQLPAWRENHIVMQEGEHFLRVKPSMKLIFRLQSKKKKKKACNMGINVYLRWKQALNLLPGTGVLWLVHAWPC